MVEKIERQTYFLQFYIFAKYNFIYWQVRMNRFSLERSREQKKEGVGDRKRSQGRAQRSWQRWKIKSFPF